MPQNSSDRDTFIRITTIENLNITNMIDGVTKIWSLNKFDFLGTKISSSQTCLNLLNQKNLVLVTASGSRSSTMGDLSMTIVLVFN